MNISTQYIVIVLMILTAPLWSHGQSQDTLRRQKSNIYSGEIQISPMQALTLMQSYADAYAEMPRAKSSYDGANVFGFIGGFLIGWPLGSAIAGGDPNWVLAGARVGHSILLKVVGQILISFSCQLKLERRQPTCV